MSTPLTTLRSILGPNDPVWCFECETGHELCLWTSSALTIFCPRCGTPRRAADAIQEAREGER